MPEVPTISRPRYFWPLIVGLMLFGFFMRLHHIGVQSLWGDEGWTYFFTQQTDPLYTLARDVHPPLYFGLVYQWVRIAGTTELALRYLSLLPGVLGLAMVYQLAREILRHRSAPAASWIPMLALFFLATADMEVHVAQEARTYTLQIFLAITSTWAYLRWIRLGRRSSALLWLLSAALIVHTHYLGAWTPVAQGLHALLFLRGRQRVQAIAILVLAALCFLPWLLGVTIPQQLGTFSGNLKTDSSDLYTLWVYRISWFGQMWPLMLGLALLGVLPFDARNRLRWSALRAPALLLFWAVLPLALTFAANLFLPTLYDYRVSQITPAIALLTAFGLALFQPSARAFLLAAIFVYGATTVDVYRPKEPWREYAHSISEFAAPGDAVLMDIGGGDYQLEYYLDTMLPPGVPNRSMWQWRYWQPATYETGLPAYLFAYDTIWLAQWNDSREAQRRLELSGHVQTSLRTTDHWGNPLNAMRFDRIPDQPLTTFANDFALRRADLHPDLLRVDLWWSSPQRPAADYTTSAILLNEAGQLVAQLDSQPFLDARPTGSWQPGEVVYDPKPLQLVGLDALPPGEYRAAAQIYLWTPAGIEQVLTADGERFFLLGSFSR